MAMQAKKLCERCGRVAWVDRRQVRCRTVPNGAGAWTRRYYCWGDLRLVPVGTVEQEAARVSDPDHAAAERIRERARVDLARAERELARAVNAVAREARRVQRLNRDVSYLAKRATVTDAEVALERRVRAERKAARPVRRGILLLKEHGS